MAGTKRAMIAKISIQIDDEKPILLTLALSECLIRNGVVPKPQRDGERVIEYEKTKHVDIRISGDVIG